MRDVLIVVGSAEAQGGVQVRWRGLARALAASRRVTVLTWSPRTLPRLTTEDGYRVVRLPSLVGWDRDHGRVLEMANALVSIAGGVLAAVLLGARWRIAVGAGLHPEGVVAGLAARLLRRPFVAETWLVGPYGNAARLSGSLATRPIVRLLSSARVVLTATQESADELAGVGIRPDRILVAIAAIDAQRFAARPEARDLARQALGVRAPFALLYAGRFDLRQKRLDLLLDAWRAVAPNGWELVLLGDGEDRAAVRELAAGIPGVHVRPWVDDVAMALVGADAFALPTRFESPGYALFEGMATGLPGLASDIALYRELAPGGVTLVAPSVEAWASALRRLTVSTPADRTARGAAARCWVESNLPPSELGPLEAVLDG